MATLNKVSSFKICFSWYLDVLYLDALYLEIIKFNPFHSHPIIGRSLSCLALNSPVMIIRNGFFVLNLLQLGLN